MRKLSPTVLKRFENFLRQRGIVVEIRCPLISKSDTFGLQPGSGQKDGAICTQAV